MMLLLFGDKSISIVCLKESGLKNIILNHSVYLKIQQKLLQWKIDTKSAKDFIRNIKPSAAKSFIKEIKKRKKAKIEF